MRLDGVRLETRGPTRAAWVTGLAPWEEGEVYDPEDVAELERRLLETGVYDGVGVALAPTDQTLPDGNQNIVYSNFAGQTMLLAFKSGSDEWCEFWKYNAQGQVVLHANPSAVSGYEEQYADLLHEVSGNYQYLRDSDGLLHTFEYHAPAGT